MKRISVVFVVAALQLFGPRAWSIEVTRVPSAGPGFPGIRVALPAVLPGPSLVGVLPMAASPSPLAASAAPTVADVLKETVAELGPEAVTAPDYKPGLVRHIVLFRYKDFATAEQKAEVKRRFLALKQVALRQGRPYIVDIETGAQSSGEGVDQQFEQGFLVTFRSEGDRNYYVGQPIIADPRYYDPAHQAFKDFVGPLLREPVNPAGVFVFDYAIEIAKQLDAR